VRPHKWAFRATRRRALQQRQELQVVQAALSMDVQCIEQAPENLRVPDKSGGSRTPVRARRQRCEACIEPAELERTAAGRSDLSATSAPPGSVSQSAPPCRLREHRACTYCMERAPEAAASGPGLARASPPRRYVRGHALASFAPRARLYLGSGAYGPSPRAVRVAQAIESSSACSAEL
jgi:hypothetical protein